MTTTVFICNDNHPKHTFNPTLTSLWIKHCIVKVKTDTHCFKYGVLAALHHHEVTDHVDRKGKYRQWKYEHVFDGVATSEHHRLTGTMPIQDISRFEKVNNIEVNVQFVNINNVLIQTYLRFNKVF